MGDEPDLGSAAPRSAREVIRKEPTLADLVPVAYGIRDPGARERDRELMKTELENLRKLADENPAAPEKIVTLEGELAEMEEQDEAAKSLQSFLEQLVTEKGNLERKIGELEGHRKGLTEEVDAVKTENGSLIEQITALKDTVTSLEAEREEFRKQLDQAQKKIDDFEKGALPPADDSLGYG